MKIINALKQRKILVIAILAYLVTFLFNREIPLAALKTFLTFLIEMVQILPLIFIISALISEWVPKEIITKNLGKHSGLKGVLLSFFLGSISAGPIYAAFPMTHTLHKKGASLRNITIIISAWATIKIPMLMMEYRFMGGEFTLLRYLATLPAIMIIGLILGRNRKIHIPSDPFDHTGNVKPSLDERLQLLPDKNCGACGFKDCKSLAAEVLSSEEITERCLLIKAKK